MNTSSRDRSRRRAAASALTAIALAVGVLVLAIGLTVPEPWWPRTGQAFVTDPRPARQNPCRLIGGPAKAYCERGTTSASGLPRGAAGTAWRLVPAGGPGCPRDVATPQARRGEVALT